jgi:hypothetical protein
MNPSYKTYNYADIKKLSVWRYKSVGRGIGHGALIGGGTGGLTILLLYKKSTVGLLGGGGLDFGRGMTARGGAILGTYLGVIIGGIVGSARLKFNIHRNKAQFNDMRTRVLEKAYRNVPHSTSNQFVPAAIDK